MSAASSAVPPSASRGARGGAPRWRAAQLAQQLALLVALLLGACRGGDHEGAQTAPAGSGAAAPAGSGAAALGGAGAAGSASTGGTPAGELPGNRAAEPEGPTGELVHAIDRKSTQGFGRGDLAVGGGWIYWIERPRVDAQGLDKAVVRRKPAARPAADPEPVAGPGKIHAIAADAARVYIAGDQLSMRPHGDGLTTSITGGAWLEVVSGDQHLLLRSRKEVALIAKRGGLLESVWEGKHGKLSVDADGDRFVAIPVSPWAQKSAARAIIAYTPGAKPAVIAELPEARGDLAVDGDWIYFGGEAGPAKPAPPLWRISKGGGKPERVGDPAWGFGEFIIRKGTLYGMVFTGAWKLQKLALSPGAQPVAIEGRVPSMIQALATDETHLYYLTDFEVKRAPR